ncbi:DUF6338 family protein [Dietzia natronolimnaea]|uniref:DUF6338 family protein n=1 Tax=Dietzia natronolimnaea TaxID=161920 RepID=UPI003D14958D
MPTAPANEFQLLALLLIILPGVVFEAVSTSFRGPSPTQRDGTGRVLSALAVSARSPTPQPRASPHHLSTPLFFRHR